MFEDDLVYLLLREHERCRFVDANPSSPTMGRAKFGSLYRIGFDIKPEGLGFFEFTWSGEGKIRPGAG